MQDLRITTLQTDLIWEDAAANRARFDAVLATIEPTDLVVLPEMFSTGFTMNPAPMAEQMDGNTITWMLEKAKALNTAICGSIIIHENNKYFNRFVVAFASGGLQTYDKRHLFSMAGETEHYTPGKSQLIFELNGIRIMPLVCYDLRFPVWSRRTQKNNYDVLLCVANWPKPRISAWSSLLVGRAIENQCYVVGVNRIGTDGNNHEYVGQTAVVDSKGETLYSATFNTAETKQTLLNYNELVDFRKKFPAINDADEFEIIL